MGCKDRGAQALHVYHDDDTTSSRKPEAQPRMAQGQQNNIHFQNISVMEQFVYSIVLLVSQAFLTDPPTTVFLLNMQMASVGLTLVAASHMIMVCSAFMNTLNLVVLEQHALHKSCLWMCPSSDVRCPIVACGCVLAVMLSHRFSLAG
jgi:hypothetical protein